MRRTPIKVYADTSVYGGVFDEEFEEASRLFFQQVDMGLFKLVTSTIVKDEIIPAPEPVVDWFKKYNEETILYSVDEEVVFLHERYMQEGIVGQRSETDALHVALATVSNCSILVSWNFKDIVHMNKIPMYNAVNILNGYDKIAIHSPEEVIVYEEG